MLVSALVFFQNNENERIQNINRTAGIAIEAEQNNKTRTILEENTDSIIKETIEREILLNNLNPKEINRKIAENLMALFDAAGKNAETPRQISFFSGNFSKSRYNEIIFSKNKKALELKDIAENSKVSIAPIAKNAFIAEFSFTGGIMKDKIFGAEISSKNSSQFFIMPIDYTLKAVVAK